MSYLLKSKSANHVMREGHGKDKRLLHVGAHKWVAFADLPPGLSSEGDKDTAVVVVGGGRIIPDSEIEDARAYDSSRRPAAVEPPPRDEHNSIGISKRSKHRR
jgi:hypothetical protein